MVLLKICINKLELLKTAHFFVALRKIILNVLNIRLALFCLCVLNCTHFQKLRTQKMLSGGFTLIEVIVVISIMTVVLSSTLFFNLGSYRGDAFRAEGKMLQTILQTARADSMNNINQRPHGVVFFPSGYDGYITFEGADYAHSEASTSIRIPTTYHVILEPSSPHEIVFSQLSGDTNYQGNIILIDHERHASTTIGINYEGAISY